MLFGRRSNVIKLRRQRTPAAVTGHLLDDVIADDVMTRLPASNDDDDDDTDDVDEHFRDAVYRSVKRSTPADRHRRPRSPMRRLLDRPASTDHRAEAVVYRPTRAPEPDYRHAGCAICGDTTTTLNWMSGSTADVDDRPDLIDVCPRPQCCPATSSQYMNFAHRGLATIR